MSFGLSEGPHQANSGYRDSLIIRVALGFGRILLPLLQSMEGP